MRMAKQVRSKFDEKKRYVQPTFILDASYT